MNVLITAATATELLPARELAEVLHTRSGNTVRITMVQTGIGNTATAYHTLKALSLAEAPYNLALNIGIAGSFQDSLPIGSVVRLHSDYFGDSGIQTASGFQSLFDAQLLDADTFPFKSGVLLAPSLPQEIETAIAPIPKVAGVSMQHITDQHLPQIYRPADIETMESASFFYVCLYEKIPFLALRAISNKVGERDKSKWNIPLALEELKNTLKGVF